MAKITKKGRIKVLFHSIDGKRHCADGMAAAWCAWLQWGDDALYIPVVYGQEPPAIEPADTVYLLDFSYPRAVLEAWVASGTKVHVFDHHKTAQSELEGLSYAHFDMKRSGAQMAWEEFRIGEQPAMIRYVADRDLWNHALPYTREVHLAHAQMPQDFELYSELGGMGETEYVRLMRAIGTPLLAQRTREIAALCAQAQKVEWMGHRVFWLSGGRGELVSDVLNKLCDERPDVDFAVNEEPIARGDGGTDYRYNFRSVGKFDVSAVAKRFGGGGHRNAAGCFRSLTPLNAPNSVY